MNQTTLDLLILAAMASTISIINFWGFINKHAFTRIVLNAPVRLPRGKSLIQSPWTKAKGMFRDFSARNLGYWGAYALIGYGKECRINNYQPIVILGTLVAVGVAYNGLGKVISLLIHEKSIFHRKDMLLKRYPTFTRQILLFKAFRRFLSIVISLATVSYGLSIIDSTFISYQATDVPFFWLHIRSTLAGVTALGSDPLTFLDIYAQMFIIARTILGYFIFIGMLIIFLAGIAGTVSIQRKDLIIENPRKEEAPNVENTVKESVSRLIRVDLKNIHSEDHLVTGLGMDSLDIVQLKMDIEDTFNMEIQESDYEKASNIGDLVKYIKSKSKTPRNKINVKSDV